jgi:hypothetical protein
MTTRSKRVVLGALCLVLAAATGLAQGLGVKKSYTLTITVNVPGAQIFIDNKLISGNRASVVQAMHNVKVVAAGYQDYVQNVNVTGDMTLTVNLRPVAWPLTVRVNVPNASILIDGVDVTGQAIVITFGSHTIQVTAPGYKDYATTLNINAAPAALDVALQRLGFLLSVTANAPDATVTINNVVKGPVPYQDYVPAGRYTIQVSAQGFVGSSQTVDVRGDTALPFTLRPMVFPVTFKVNVPRATIYLDGRDVTGKSALVMAGQHTLQVVAPGYQDYNTVLDVSGPPGQVEINMLPAGVLLTVNANVPGATVILNNFPKGEVPYSEYLPAGGYTIRVSADGYADYIASVSLDKPVTVSAKLKALPKADTTPGTLALVVPPAFAATDVRANDPVAQIKIYVDNKLVNANRALDGISVTPGRHRIRVSSGGLSIDVGDITVQPGMSYVIEIALDAQIRAVAQEQQ